MADNDIDDVRARLRQAIYEMLIDKIGSDQYPSATMMNMVEMALDDDRLLRAYASTLYDKVSNDRYPSTDMLKRLSRLT